MYEYNKQVDNLFDASIKEAIVNILTEWPELRLSFKSKTYEDFIKTLITSDDGLKKLIDILNTPREIWNSVVLENVVDF